MALGTPTVGTRYGANLNAPKLIPLSFIGDASVSAGGVTGFTAYVKAAIGNGENITIDEIISGECGGYVCVYVAATDAIKFYQSNSSATVLAEATGDLHATTFHITVVAH